MIEPEIIGLAAGGNITTLGVVAYFIRHMLGRERKHYDNGSETAHKLDKLIQLQTEHNTYAKANSVIDGEFRQEVRDRLSK